MEYIYPAKFIKEKGGGYSVSFPDFYGAFTEGDDLKQALSRAEDCLGGVLAAYSEDKKALPQASSLTVFPVNTESEFINLIKINLAEYLKRVDERPVRKTVYIPKGLNDQAETLGINFSKVLRDALTIEIEGN